MVTKEGDACDKPLLQQEGYEFMSAVLEVYKDLGCGFLEEVYQESLERELSARGIRFESKPEVKIFYKGLLLNKAYQADLIVFDQILVELKAIRSLAPEHEAQTINYLRATRKRVGYLINFGTSPRMQWKRFIV